MNSLDEDIIDPNKSMLNLFQIDLENLEKTYFAFFVHKILSASEIDALPYYRYEGYVEQLKDYLEKKQAAESGNGQQGQSMDVNKEASKFMKNVPTPKMPNFKMPNLKK